MIKNKAALLSWLCAAMLVVYGCSRQQSDWQKTRETNTTDSYEQFLKKYPSGEFTAQAQARVKELYEERDWQKARDADTPEAYQAFLKQYPEGKWTEEARIRVENFTLAQAPSSAVPGASPAGGAPGAGSPATGSTAVGTSNGEAMSSGTASSSASSANERARESAMPSLRKQTSKTTSQPATQTARVSPSKTSKQVSASHASAASSGKAIGSFGVQLGAFKSGPHAAHERWARLEKEYPTVLKGLSSSVVAKKTSVGTLYRLQANGLSEKHARALCSTLKAKAQVCIVVPPAHAET